MSTWHQLTHKTSGEEQIVASLDGIDLDEWTAAKLPAKPKPDEEVKQGKITKRVGGAKKDRDKSSISHLTLAELMAIIDERVAASVPQTK